MSRCVLHRRQGEEITLTIPVENGSPVTIRVQVIKTGVTRCGLLIEAPMMVQISRPDATNKEAKQRPAMANSNATIGGHLRRPIGGEQ